MKGSERTSFRRRAFALGLFMALLASSVGQVSATPTALCRAGDLPETGLQGDVPRQDQLSGRAMEGYNCGLALVGHNDLGGRGGNANMAWSGNCSYVSGGYRSGNGIAVVDVSNPRRPKLVRTLHGPGSTDTNETLHAVTTRKRAVLVAGRYSLAPNDDPAPMDVYDVRDCKRPKLMSTFWFPASIHNLTVSADGRRVFSTLRLQVADISNLRKPRFLGDLEEQIPVSGLSRNVAHEAWPSPDGKRLYIAGQVAGFGEVLTILDISKWPGSPPRVVRQTEGPGHSIRQATIRGKPYLLHSEESVLDPTAKGCLPDTLNPVGGAAQPWLTDISDERRPLRVSQFRLEINEPINCPAQLISGVNASVHYHDVDDPRRTTFAMLSMWNAGLRVVDVRDPHRPMEVAYFNPGMIGISIDQTMIDGTTVLDHAWGHVRYMPSTGHIWFATATGGFWVVELEPQVRRALGLRPKPQWAPATRPRVIPAAIVYQNPDAYYCSL